VRVLVQIRTNSGERDGGDTLHAERKAAELRALGVEVDVRGEWAADPSSYDLVHLYNTVVVVPTLRRALRARGCGVPVVLETIYWDTSYFHPPVPYRHEQGMCRLALDLSTRAISNSAAEAALVARDFPDAAERVDVVPLGVDARPDIGHGDAAGFCERYGLAPGFVLCAGRKELRKNQLRLIRACGSLGVTLVLAGAEHPEAEWYVAECRAAGAASGADVRFLPHLEGPELAGAFAAAGVHVQPSIWETVGLSTLEAALAGCNVVATSESGIADYLGDDAWYCDPWSERSIAEAVAAARAAPHPATDVAARLREQFTWRRAAEETLVVYEAAMREHEQRQGALPLPAPQYTEHLEELVQLQLEAIAYRDEQAEAVTARVAELGAEVGHVRGELARADAAAAHARAEAEQVRAELAHVREELAYARNALEQTRAELERVQATRLFRWSSPLRRLYALTRGRGVG
jgi:glycosyltransferase involved in cell wall biosynthesis